MSSNTLLPLDNYDAFLDELHDERDDLYEQTSSFSISSDNGRIGDHVRSVIETMQTDER